MQFDKQIEKILEGFNVFPQAQTAPSMGPDTGMTSGDQQNTFPSKMMSLKVQLPKKKKSKLKKRV
jgi:hypothetical protein